MNIRGSREGIPVLGIYEDGAIRAGLTPPEPGERCQLCNRRRNKPRKDDSPVTREIRIKLPVDRMESVEEAFDALQELTGVDPYSYPRGVLLEALLLLGAQQREELAAYFQSEGADSR